MHVGVLQASYHVHVLNFAQLFKILYNDAFVKAGCLHGDGEWCTYDNKLTVKNSVCSLPSQDEVITITGTSAEI